MNNVFALPGQINPLRPLLLDSKQSLDARSRQQCGAESRALWTWLESGLDLDLTLSPLKAEIKSWMVSTWQTLKWLCMWKKGPRLWGTALRSGWMGGLVWIYRLGLRFQRLSHVNHETSTWDHLHRNFTLIKLLTEQWRWRRNQQSSKDPCSTWNTSKAVISIFSTPANVC